MASPTLSSQQRRVSVLHRAVSESYVDPRIAKAVSAGDRSQQLFALQASGTSAGELRRVAKKLEAHGRPREAALTALAGGLASLFAGQRTLSALTETPTRMLRALGWASALLTAASITLASLLDRMESRNLAPILSQAAAAMDAAHPAASLIQSTPVEPYLRRS